MLVTVGKISVSVATALAIAVGGTNVAVATALGLQLDEDSAALSIVQRQYQHLYEQGIVSSPDLTESRRKMARIPVGSTPLDNTV